MTASFFGQGCYIGQYSVMYVLWYNDVIFFLNNNTVIGIFIVNQPGNAGEMYICLKLKNWIRFIQLG